MYDDPAILDWGMETGATQAGDLSAFLGIFAAFVIPMIILTLVLYVYYALALMKIAQKNNTPNAWLAWIPIANLYLMTQIAQVPWWTFLVAFVAWIPLIGPIALLGVTIWWWLKIAERMKKPNWWGIMIALVPIANLIFLGMLAWGKNEN